MILYVYHEINRQHYVKITSYEESVKIIQSAKNAILTASSTEVNNKLTLPNDDIYFYST
jgi:hypothetical protein